MKNAMYMTEHGRALIANGYSEYETTRLRAGTYVKVFDGSGTKQLCAGASMRGPTLVLHRDETKMAEYLARECNARLYLTRRGYDAARKRLEAELMP